MNLHLTRNSRWALSGIAALALGLLVACGGGDDTTTLTAEQAQQVADAALFVIGDLPAGDWEQDEEQASIDQLLPTGGDLNADLDVPAECQTFQSAMSDLPALLGDVEPIASSGRSFAIVGDTLSAQLVSSTVLVFERSEDATAASEALQNALDTDGIQDCLLSAMGPIADAGIEIAEFTADRPDYALDDSTGLSIRVDAVAFILPIQLAIDVHIFDRGNSLAMYLALELNGEELQTLHGDLLEIFAGRVEDAQN
ncbi:MAG: hypothetical protein HOH95_02025 [Dehalococcoidia bacterium]|jgi:hypothetical protein|nr:hypothetical protein [Dehalococcoidia bacterium]